jgi:hypothetical protein
MRLKICPEVRSGAHFTPAKGKYKVTRFEFLSLTVGVDTDDDRLVSITILSHA